MLALRIEQHSHWRQAPSVLDGRQPARDPDRESLVGLRDGIRLYSQQVTRDGKLLRVCKRLVDGVWEQGTIEAAPAIADDENAPVVPVQLPDYLARGPEPLYGVGQIARIRP